MHSTLRPTLLAFGVVIGAAAVVASPAASTPFEETFEGFAAGGSVGSPTANRNQGTLQGNWFVEDGIGGAVIDQQIVGQGRNGGNALRIGGAVGTGVSGITSPSATPPVGESGTTASFPAGGGSTVADTARGASRMSYNFDFRTFASAPDKDDEFFIDFGVSDLTSRLGWVRLSNVNGEFGVQSAAFSTATNELQVSNIDLDLGWGDWYTMNVGLEFNDGPDNDTVTYSLLDNAGNLVNSVSIGSWEGLYQVGLNALPAVHQMSVQVQDFSSFGYTATSGQGVLIDNVRIAAIPTPATWLLFAAGLVWVFLPQLRGRLRRAEG